MVIRFSPSGLTSTEISLRDEVRAFVASELAEGAFTPGLGIGTEPDVAFSHRLAARGWVGMVVPKEYGGPGHTAVERFIVAEELLAAGAPITAHWVGDRQTAQMFLAFGTEEQKHRFLPMITRADVSFSLGLSEPDSGSDLASVRTRANRVEGGWIVNGRKIWTSGAHRADFVVCLCRTSPVEDIKHAGLSQLIIDLHSDGVLVTPILLLNGAHHFNEVVFDDVFVPDGHLLGSAGDGWSQVTSELTFERSGPDRFLTTLPLLVSFLDNYRLRPADTAGREAVGRLFAKYWALHNMSLAIARSLDEGSAPALEAALLKDAGTVFEQEVVTSLRQLVADAEPVDERGNPEFEQLFADAVVTAPTFTLRGGTNEVLRILAAKRLRDKVGTNATSPVDGDLSLLHETLVAMLTKAWSVDDRRAYQGELPEHVWSLAESAGFTDFGDTSSDTSLAASLVVAYALGQTAVPVPLVEMSGLACWVLGSAGLPIGSGIVTAASCSEADRLRLIRTVDGWMLDGVLTDVPWGRDSAAIVAIVDHEGESFAVRAPTPRSMTLRNNFAGEPRDRVVFDSVPLGLQDVARSPLTLTDMRLRGASLRSAAMVGAMQAVMAMTADHALQRQQFGRSIWSFYAVQDHLVRMAEHLGAAQTAVDVLARADSNLVDVRLVGAAKLLAGEAAEEITARAHQIHAAIGTTMEHPLHHFTQRLWSWQDEFGRAAYWARTVGDIVQAQPGSALWESLTHDVMPPTSDGE